MGVMAYIIPQEWILRILILLMFCLAVFVFYRCNNIRKIAKENLTMLERLENVKPLEDALLSNHVNRDELFTKYENDMGKSPTTFALFEHLKTIYDAGAKSSRLDADLLVQNTISKIFNGVGSIKTSISIFLVMGILGTLIGLAISIGGFNGANFIMTSQTSSTANELSALFNNLRGAFAPSMWGVFFTICFVLGYSWVIQNGCIDKVEEKLTLNTIQYWLPKLYPTDFQRVGNSIVKLNKVIANADGINQGVTELEKNLDSSNKLLQQLQRVSKSLDTASDRFDKSTDKIAQIKTLYEELRKANSAFNDSLQQLIDSAIADRKNAYQQYVEISKHNYDNINAQGESLQKQIIALQKGLQEKTEQQSQQVAAQMATVADNTKKYFDTLSAVMQHQNDTFSEGIKTQSNIFSTNIQNQSKAWQDLLAAQNQKLTTVLEQLKSYDEHFFATVTNAGESLKTSIEVNRKAAAANQELAEQLRLFETKLMHQQDELMEKLIQPIQETLQGMGKGIYQQLDKVSSELHRIQDPLEATTTEMQKMIDKSADKINELIKPIQEITQQLRDKQEGFSHKEEEVSILLTGLQQTMQQLNGNLNAMMAAVAGQNGVSIDVIKKYMEDQAKLAAGAGNRTGKAERPNVSVDEKPAGAANGFLSVKNIPIIAIAVLLLLSVVTQVVMVTKISTLEQNQAAVNQVLMKGEMNDSSGTNP